MSELPPPPYGREVDVRDLDGFMLNVERLMASELVALSTHEEVASALFLWCRAWKQIPAASLSDDEMVIAAFARLPIARFRKLRSKVLRGFEKCSDGRLYHRTLSAEAITAHRRKLSFQGKRERDAERLRQWRLKQDGNGDETAGEACCETTDETRFVAEGQGQDGTGTGPKERERDAKNGADLLPQCDGKSPPKRRRGRQVKGDEPWPEGFALTEEMAAYAKRAHFDPVWLFEKFETKAKAKGWVYRDWTAAFRNFATTEQVFSRPNGGLPPSAHRAPDV